MRALPHQHGYSLIELMIAGTLGLIVVLGITNMFVASRQTNNLARAVNDIQDDARFGLEMLNRSARKAGYYPKIISTPGNQTINLALVYTDAVTAIPPVTTTANWTAEGAAGASDSVGFLSFYDSTGRTDCTGATPGANTYWVDRYYINNNALTCRSHGVDVTSAATIANSGAAGTETALIDGVSDLQVEYGVDDDADDSVDYWMQLASVPNLSSITAVRLWFTITDDIQGVDPLSDKTVSTTRFFQDR